MGTVMEPLVLFLLLLLLLLLTVWYSFSMAAMHYDIL